MTASLRRVSTIAACLCALLAASAADTSRAIYKGERARFGDFEFMVSLRWEKHPSRHMCGGTLIAPDVMLTAAHCVVAFKPTKLTTVVATDKPDWRGAKRVPITGYRIAPGFSIKRSNRSDIALLRLAKAQSSPVVALGSTEPEIGARAVTTGWGCTSKPPSCRDHPTRLRLARERVIPDSRCNRSRFWNPPAHLGTSICADGSGRSSANLGDSGGPLFVGDAATGFTQVGVVSLGSDKPGTLLNAFASVPELRGWVDRAAAGLSRTG